MGDPHMTVSNHATRWRLLLVEDDEANYRLVRRLLGRGLPGARRRKRRQGLLAAGNLSSESCRPPSAHCGELKPDTVPFAAATRPADLLLAGANTAGRRARS